MPDDLRRELEEAGRRPVPDPGPGFEDSLEARLMAVVVTPPPPPPSRSPWRRPVVRLAAGFASLVLVLGIVTFGVDDRSALAFELTGSVNVEVALADGTTLTDPDGLLLPDGAVVRVGADGFARVGGMELHEGDIARLIGGRLRIDRQPTGVVQTDATPTSPPSSVRPSTPPPTPSPRATPSSSAAATPSTTTRPSDAPPTTRPTPTGTTVASPSPTKDPPAKTATPDTGDPSDGPTDAPRIRLQARVVGASGIRATWTAVPDARRYVLIGTRSKDGPARNPSYPGSAVVGVFTHPPAKPLAFRVNAGVTEVRLRVVALDADGKVLSRSRIVTLSMPE